MQRGTKHKPESIEKIRQTHIGVKYSEESKAKMRESRLKYLAAKKRT